MKTFAKYLVCVSAGMAVTVTAWSQPHSAKCPSNLQVTPGASTVIDCALGLESHTYQWTSMDPTWLTYLSDVTVSSPRFHAPVDIVSPYHISYRLLALDAEGMVVDQQLISITLNNLEGSARLGNDIQNVDQISLGITSDEIFESPKIEIPFLRCVPRITVGSGEMAEIPCTGFHSSEGLLTYRIELDWPPYSTTELLGTGTFSYFVRAPVIHEPTSVRILEIFAQVPGMEQEVSAHVEVHVVNRAPILTCEDLIVDEDMEVDIPCSVISDKPVQLQLLSQPTLSKLRIPSISRDSSYVVAVRAFSNDQVVESSFTVRVRNTSDPLAFRIECDPLQREVYEGEAAFEIMCKAIDPPSNTLSWVWSAEEDTPLSLLEIDLANDNFGTATFHVPNEVAEDVFYEYIVTAIHDEIEISNPAIISITVLKRPDISVVCEDVQVRTGDPPLRLMCAATNSKDLPLNYQWSWTPVDWLSDTDTGKPLFDVPSDQAALVEEYVYEVTASADFANSPIAPTQLVVTVIKNLGQLDLTCESPIEIYERSPDLPLNCSTSIPVPEDIVWSWNLVNGPGDRLIDGSNGAPPIFQTPVSVNGETTWTYLIQVDAPPHHDISEPQEVEITVLPRPILSLECPDEFEFNVGQSPQQISCEVTNDQDLDLAYMWQWMPPTRLSDTESSSPLFDVPLRQREYSQTYPYTVTVWADLADPVEASIEVIVINSNALPLNLMEVTTSPLNFGIVGPQGQVVMDPATEQLSGSIYEGVLNTGRMILRAQDSVTVSLEQLSSVTLGHVEVNRTLALDPDWAYSRSCVHFLSNTQVSQTIQSNLVSGDCHVIRFGGSVSLEDAIPGTYSGEIAVVLTLNEIEEVYTIPVILTVGPFRQIVELGPSGIRIKPSHQTGLYGEERIHIWPQMAVFEPEIDNTTFELHNPSLYPMEIEVSPTYGYREHRNGESILVTDPSTGIGNLVTSLSVHPEIIILLPGETKHVQTAISQPLADQGYAGMLNFTVTPRNYLDHARNIVPAGPSKITFQVPAIYMADSSSELIRAYLDSQTDESITVVFETDLMPFYGQVLVFDDGGKEVGHSDLLVVTRSQIQFPIENGSRSPFSLKLKPYSSHQLPLIDVHLSDNL